MDKEYKVLCGVSFMGEFLAPLNRALAGQTEVAIAQNLGFLSLAANALKDFYKISVFNNVLENYHDHIPKSSPLAIQS